MSKPEKKSDDEKAFNETLKRMLATPPTPHEKSQQAGSSTPEAAKPKVATRDD